MGTRGLSDIKGLFMGSVAHKVNQMASCTVVTVK
jgi:nucleotide-binding universal stress UspA family protein